MHGCRQAQALWCKYAGGCILETMLQLSATFINRPVLSLRTGGLVGTTTGMIINPGSLKIEGFYCQDNFDRKKSAVLLPQDIRDIIPQGIVVNDHDALTDPDELVRLHTLIQLEFSVIGKQVVTASKTKLGKVSDFAVDTDSMFIQKIYVSQSIFKNLTGGNLGIDRSQILEVTDRRITVQDLTERVQATAKAWA